MTGPLPKYDVYDLTDNQVVTFPNGAPMEPHTATPEAVKAAPDALLPGRKKPGRKPGSKNKAKKPPAKKAKAPAAVVIAAAAPAAAIPLRIAPSGEGVWDRIKRVSLSVWVMIAAIASALALGGAIAFVVVR